MKKMPCLFERTFHGRDSATLLQTVTPGCEWVLRGEGSASVKRDGTACYFDGVHLYKRYDAKKDRKTGAYKTPPAGAIPCDEPDAVTGHWPHWIPIGPSDYWHIEALAKQIDTLRVGTYELCGPMVNANPEGLTEHALLRHGADVVALQRSELSFAGLRFRLMGMRAEGIVFAHPDGRFAKIRRADYGLAWPLAAAA